MYHNFMKYGNKFDYKWKGNKESVSLALASYFKGYTAVKNSKGTLDTETDGYVKDIISTYYELKNTKDKQQ